MILRLGASGHEPPRILDRDILTCPAEEIAAIQVVQTYVNGRLVYERKQ